MSVRYLPGEREAIDAVKRLGAAYGYGNLIHHLKDAWSETMKAEYGFPQDAADRAALHICPWCDTDGRTGKKVKSMKHQEPPA